MAGTIKSRIPYGYKIVNGAAVVDPDAAERLRLYFRRYLEGKSMSEAAKEAQLPCSAGTYAKLFRRREYTGDGYYAAIITEEMQKQLMEEWERRKKRTNHMRKKPPKKGVKVYTEFGLAQAGHCQPGPGGPADCAAALYRRIYPKMQGGRNKALDSR